MKTIKNMLIFILCFYLMLSVVWIGKIAIIHYQKINGLPIIGYHGVVSDIDKDKYYSDNIYYMKESTFLQQIEYLAQNNYHTLTMDEINEYYRGNYALPKKAVALTFDDGFLNFNTIIKPILEKYNLQGTCFVIGHKTTLKNSKNPAKYQYLRKSDLINDNHVQYYSHSYDLHHKNKYVRLIETLSIAKINQDFESNRNIVSSKYFAFPYGVTSENAQIALKQQNVTLAFGYNQNRNMTPNDNQYLLPRYLITSEMPLCYFKWIVE